ncbi:hypothetical protein AAC387_Pa07g3141 [Persea americana]
MAGREGNFLVSGGSIKASSEKTCLETLTAAWKMGESPYIFRAEDRSGTSSNITLKGSTCPHQSSTMEGIDCCRAGCQGRPLNPSKGSSPLSAMAAPSPPLSCRVLLLHVRSCL